MPCVSCRQTVTFRLSPRARDPRTTLALVRTVRPSLSVTADTASNSLCLTQDSTDVLPAASCPSQEPVTPSHPLAKIAHLCYKGSLIKHIPRATSRLAVANLPVSIIDKIVEGLLKDDAWVALLLLGTHTNTTKQRRQNI